MRSVPFILGTLSACALGTNAPSNSPQRTAYTLTWVRPPSAIMPKRIAANAPALDCVAVAATQASASVSVRSPGDPIPGLDVKLGKNPNGSELSVPTDNDGIAHFCSLAFDLPGAYTLSATAEGANSILSDPFIVPASDVRLAWYVQPKASISGRGLAGEQGQCPAVKATSLTSTDPGSPARTPGEPIPGIDIKLGKNPGSGNLATATTDPQGVATFCGVTISETGAFSLRAELSSANTQLNPVYSEPIVSDPFYNGPNRRVLLWSVQPVGKKAGELYAQNCPAVTVRATTGFSDDATRFKETAGDALVGVDVEVSIVPGGQNVVATTDLQGVATFCGVAMPAGAFNLRAKTDAAEPVLSAAVTITP